MNLLKKTKTFRWDQECDEVFQNLKLTPVTPPTLAKLDAQKKLIIYLSVSEEVISVVVIQKQEGKQYPIYFVSRILHEPKTRYQLIEKWP